MPWTLEAQSFPCCDVPTAGCRSWAHGGDRAMGDPSDMTPLQTKIVHALRKRVDLRNRVTVFYEQIAGELGVSKLDVREALIELRDDGFFPGKPSFSTEQFHAHLPG
ncbi:MAG: hypothetical protein ACLP1X_07760 [Polyangiaceae bacterium]